MTLVKNLTMNNLIFIAYPLTILKTYYYPLAEGNNPQKLHDMAN